MGQSLNVLFIEDSEEDAELTAAELVRGGLLPHLRRVETQAAMREALAQQVWDIIICDYRLPNFSAQAALQTLKDSGLDIPFIIISGVVEAEETVNLLKQGAHDFMNKEALARLVPAVERELREAEERRQRREAEARVRVLSRAVEQSPVSVVISDPRGHIEYVNPRFEQVTGYSAEEAMDRHLTFTLLDKSSAASMSDLWLPDSSCREWRGECCCVRRDGQLFWEFANISPLLNPQGTVTHYIAVKEDVTVRRSYEEQLLRQAHYDHLTGLANRVLMIDRLNVALESAARNKNQVAVLCIDLDHFKNVNDSQGHSHGDSVLREAGARLSGCIRGGDTLARMGGDEFVIVLSDVRDTMAVQKVAERIIATFAQPFSIGNRDYFVTASIGIAVFPDDGTTADTLQRNADLAMYKAKDLGRNQYHYFTEDINTRLMQRLELEARLRHAVSDDELELHYQPIFWLDHMQPAGCEALVRWRQPDGQLWLPGQFIGLAEETGMIQSIDAWVLSAACSHLSKVISQSAWPLRLSLNVSSLQLQIPDFALQVARQLQLHELTPDQLELEITERVLIDDDPQTATNIRALCDLGVRLSIDDFGTGYSSLAYLQKYPFKTLKIDRTFVSRATEDANTARLVETIVTMGRSLNMEVVGEGIETEAQLELLQKFGCDLGQGYLLGRPTTLDNLQRAVSHPWQGNAPDLKRKTPAG